MKRTLKMPILRKAIVLLAAIAVLAGAFGARALTILSGINLVQSMAAPLAATLQLTTDVPSRVSVSVEDDLGRTWVRKFYDYGTVHSLPLLGFKPGRIYNITVTVHDRHRNAVTADQPVKFITDMQPVYFPVITLLQADPGRMEPGYTLFRVGVHNEMYWYGVIVDSSGEVVWYSGVPSTADLRQLDNGNLFMPWRTNFFEVNLLGQIVNSWVVPTNLPINLHEGLPTDHGTILYLTTPVMVVSNYPTSMTNPNAPLATTNVHYEKIVEISATNATLLNTWSPINFLDPRRISYLISYFGGGWDSEHANSICEDPSDDSLIVSLRHQNAVIKFSRATGELRWILGPPENWGPEWQFYLLKPVGSSFVWPYAQHSAILTPQGTLLLFDNGNFRASPFAPTVPDAKNYSRAVEYFINEGTMQVTQLWEYGRTNVAQQLYADHEGNAEWEPHTGNILVDFAAVSYVNGVAPSSYGPSATMARITEVTHDAIPQVVFDLEVSMYDQTGTSYKDCSIYRCHRIPDLYAHPAKPVADLTVTRGDGVAVLEFSADNKWTYRVEASSDLIEWEEIGVALEDELESGDFYFEDDLAGDFSARYYRIVTQ
jgi:arylsulfate sulfotransferase